MTRIVNKKQTKKDHKAININNSRLEQLLAMGIDPKFASQLNEMFLEIGASTNEITNNSSSIIKSNSKIINSYSKSRKLSRSCILSASR